MLTERQVQLLNAIIREYIDTANAVGSELVVQKYKIKCSAATVRNEMARLLDEGFLEMLHTSSGRVPTSLAYRYFLNDLMEEEELSVLQEVAMKQRLWASRFHFEKLIRNAAISLSDVTKEAAVITSNDGFIVHAGLVNLLDDPAYWKIDSAKAALYLIDNYELLEQQFEKAQGGGEVRYIIGSEFNNNNLMESSLVFAPYSVGNKSGHVAIMGPARMRYSNIVPALKYTKNLLEELGESW
jgi:transcriptional regulator of heat shock response